MQRHGKDRSRKDREKTGYDLPSGGNDGKSKGKDWQRYDPRWHCVDQTGRGMA